MNLAWRHGNRRRCERVTSAVLVLASVTILKDLEKTTPAHLIITVAVGGVFEKISYARVRVESRSKDGNFDRVETAYAAGMGLV